jgi:ATP diphosphatase
MQPGRDIGRLLSIMAALRTPGTGCPWDLEQDFASIVPYTLEEAYEVADAVARGDMEELAEELGDLLLQVVFHARMAEEIGAFDFGDVVLAITSKLIRRHPHVFGTARGLEPRQVKALWDAIKAEEKATRRRRHQDAGPRLEDSPSALDGVPLALPALSQADKLARRAAAVGFDWPDPGQVAAKIAEELAEICEAAAEPSRERIVDEIGDLLFAAANLARHYDVDPEAALRQANAKFSRRFRGVEGLLAARGRSPTQSNLEEMEQLWQDVKAAERGKP